MPCSEGLAHCGVPVFVPVAGKGQEDAAGSRRSDREGEAKRKDSVPAQAATLPKEMMYVKFADLERVRGMEEAYDELSEVDIEADRTWMCVYGLNNTGKSRLLAATSNRQIGKLVPTLYINESLFFTQVKESWENQGEVEGDGGVQVGRRGSVGRVPVLQLHADGIGFTSVPMRCSSIWQSMDKKVIFATNTLNIRQSPGVDSIETMCGKRIWARLQRRNTRYIQMRNEPFHKMY